MVLTKSAAVILLPPCDAVAFPILLLSCGAPAGGAAGGGVSVAGGACVSPPPAGGACVSPPPAGGACVSPPPAAGACVSPPAVLLSSPLALAASIPNIITTATKIGKTINHIGFSTPRIK